MDWLAHAVAAFKRALLRVRSREAALTAANAEPAAEYLARKPGERALRESEARFRSLTALSSDWYWEQDENYRFLPEGMDSGLTRRGAPRRYVGMTRWEHLQTDLTEEQWAAHRAMLDARQPFHEFEYSRIGANGEREYVSISGGPIFDEDGKFRGYRGIGRDITERKRADQLLALEHKVARCLAEAESESAALQAVIGAICATQNWEFGRYWKVDEQAAVLRFAASWSVPGAVNAEQFRKLEDTVFSRGTGMVGEVWRTGQPLWVPDLAKDPRVIMSMLILDAGMHGACMFPVLSAGKIIGVLAFVSREVREPDERLLAAVMVIGSQVGQFLQRKQAEEEQRESRQLLDNIIENIPTAVQVQSVKNDLRVMLWNKAAEEMFGVPREDAMGRNVYDLWPQADAQRMHASDCELIASGGTQDFPERVHLTRHRGKIDVHMRKVALLDAGGTPTHLLVIADDISKRKENDKALRRFRAAMDTTPDAIYLTDRTSMRFIDVNEAACSTQGCSREELLSRNPEDVLSMPRAALERIYDSVIAGGTATEPVEMLRPRPGGTQAWIEVQRRALRMGEGWMIVTMARDITARKRAEEDLRRFRAAMDGTADAIYLFDLDYTRVIDVNDGALRMLGYSREELLALAPGEFLRQMYPIPEAVLTGSRADAQKDFESIHRRKDGSLVPVEVQRRAIRSGDTWIVVSVARDIAERKEAEAKIIRLNRVYAVLSGINSAIVRIRERGELFKEACRIAVSEGGFILARVIELDPGGRARIAATSESDSQQYQEMIDEYNGNSAHSQSLIALALRSGQPVVSNDIGRDPRIPNRAALAKHGTDALALLPIIVEKRVAGAIVLRAREAGMFVEDELRLLLELVSNLSFALELMDKRQELDDLAFYDALTGMPNRNLLLDRFAQTLTQAQRSNRLAAVMFIDLDRFKAVNDTFGHSLGDELLVETAKRLQQCVRASDTVARLGGDEFAVVLSTLAKADDAGLVAQKVVASLSRAFSLQGQEAYVSASVGIAIYPDDGTAPEVLLKNADTAMYRAKEEGRNAFQFYLPQMNERAVERLRMETQLRGALERGEFLLHYQPKVNLASGEISGFEALLRWQHPQRGLVPPLEFISILEDTGLIVPVGEWVVRTVCGQLLRWQADGIKPRPVAINLSARQFQQKNLDSVIGAILEETGVDPRLLEFELTESMLMSDPEAAVRTLKNMKAYGVRLSVDDFGTGYSSLAYLKRFPLDALKIDRAFIRDVTVAADDATIAMAIISLAHNLKLKVVAEGVETEAQLNFLRTNGCDEMQGFYFSRPLAIADCTRALTEDLRLQGASGVVVRDTDKPRRLRGTTAN